MNDDKTVKLKQNSGLQMFSHPVIFFLLEQFFYLPILNYYSPRVSTCKSHFNGL